MTQEANRPAESSIRVRRGVIAIIEQGPRLLTIRRAAHLTKGGHWYFPGGHVEPGENSRRAIRRELEEELGIETTPLERIGAVRVPDPGYVLAVWRVQHVHGELRPDPREVAEVRWLLPHEVRAIQPGLPSTRCVMDLVDAHPH